MKTRIGKVVLIASMAISAIFTQRAYGGTTHTFCQYLGDVASPSQAQLTNYANFLSNNSIDFGVFYGATSAANFGLTAEGYTAVTTVTSGYPGRTLVYKTSEWDCVKHYDLEAVSSYYMQTEAYVMRRKSTDALYLFAMPTCTKDSGLKKTSGASVARGYANSKAANHPGALVLVAIPYTNGLKRENEDHLWNADLTGNNYTRTLAESNTGAVFVKNNNNTMTCSGASASGVTGSDAKAATATITYSEPCTVTFLDWDGTELKTETVLEGGDATPPVDPKRAEYVFAGWNGSYQNIQANVTLTAQYDLDNSPGMIMMCW